jgi:hypothetical protein
MTRWRVLTSNDAVGALASKEKERFSVARARAKMEREVFML